MRYQDKPPWLSKFAGSQKPPLQGGKTLLKETALKKIDRNLNRCFDELYCSKCKIQS